MTQSTAGKLQIHESTLPTLDETERLFLDLFVKDGRAEIIADGGADNATC
jgi:hypothetical protein